MLVEGVVYRAAMPRETLKICPRRATNPIGVRICSAEHLVDIVGVAVRGRPSA
jgi:hypothetical protein